MEPTEEQKVLEPQAPKKSNPLLERKNKMPPETFRMPSMGKLYRNGEIDANVTNGEVIIYPMTTVDEITMRSPDMIFQGTAVEKVFLRCIPEIHKPMDMLANDVDYLLVCLRMITYGDNLEIYWECPVCKAEKEKLKAEKVEGSDEEVEVRQTRFDNKEDARKEALRMTEDQVNVRPTYTLKLSEILKKTKTISEIDEEKFFVKVSSGETIKLRPSTFGELLRTYQTKREDIDDPDELANFIFDTLLCVIENVDGHTDRNNIREWLASCTAPVLAEIEKHIHIANDWGMTYEHTVVCKKCNFTKDIEVPLNPIHFFIAPLTTQTNP